MKLRKQNLKNKFYRGIIPWYIKQIFDKKNQNNLNNFRYPIFRVEYMVYRSPISKKKIRF